MSNYFVIKWAPTTNGILDFKPVIFYPGSVSLSGYSYYSVTGNYTIFAYTTVGTFTNAITTTTLINQTLQFFVVAGGGSGGCDQAGGGGAGGVLQSSVTLNGNDTVSITVGAGGIANAGSNISTNGANSTVSFSVNTSNNITSVGGGGGQSYGNSGNGQAYNGGSGGGGYNTAGGSSGTTGQGTVGQGNNGGGTRYGGGGGAGMVGYTPTTGGGAGGDGVQIGLSYFSGSPFSSYYWGGGGGGGCGGGVYAPNGPGGNGGKGGGGGGSSNNLAGGTVDTTTSLNAGTAGKTSGTGGPGGSNTGGGGGGSSQGGGNAGGTGGSGIVLVAIPNALVPAIVFLPTMFSNLAFWFDAKDSASITLSGSNVTQWNDKSGNARNATLFNTNYATYSASALNGKPALVFTGSATGYSAPSSASMFAQGNGFTCFVVFQSAASLSVSYQSLINQGNGNVSDPWDFYDTSRLIGPSGQYQGQNSTQNYRSYTSATLYGFSIDGTNTPVLSEWFNGGTGSGTATWTSTAYTVAAYGTTGTLFYIGTRADKVTGFSGNMSEVVVFNKQLTNIQRQQIEGYLAWKWGLQANLPAAHPYKNSAP